MLVEPLALSDEAVVDALHRGDQRVFVEYYAHHTPAMRRLARAYLSSDALIDEVVQETWMAVVRGIDRFQGRSALSTWVFSILINQAKTLAARERRMVPMSCVGAGDGHEDGPAVDPDRFQKDDEEWPGHWATPPRAWSKPDRRLLSLEAREHLARALGCLPDRQRVIVALRDVEGLSAEEVCERLALSPENQRVLLHRGRSRLRAELERYVDGH